MGQDLHDRETIECLADRQGGHHRERMLTRNNKMPYPNVKSTSERNLCRFDFRFWRSATIHVFFGGSFFPMCRALQVWHRRLCGAKLTGLPCLKLQKLRRLQVKRCDLQQLPSSLGAWASFMILLVVVWAFSPPQRPRKRMSFVISSR